MGSVIKGIIALVVLALILYFAGVFGGTDEITQENDLIRVESPVANSAVASPLVITGEARGPWYFEASFAVSLLNENGEELAIAPAVAEGEWMTEEFVPFSATLTWTSDYEGPGTLILEKANPSGLPENADSIEISVVIEGSEEADTMTLSIYFGKEGTNECENVVAVEREVAQTQGVAQAALNELLSGPTEEELAEGYITNIPEGVEIESVRVEDKVAYADFSSALDENVAGSCRVAAIRAQITETLLQFPTVEDVVISIDGETEEILQP